MSDSELALFPLNTVLYPGGPLPLQIFEPRYLAMVSECLREDRPFGVCLIASGTEAGAPAVPHGLGTTARIVDWSQNANGLLAITAVGEQRFRVSQSRVQEDGLLRGAVTLLDHEPSASLPERYRHLAELLGKLVERAGTLYQHCSPAYDDASWVGFRFLEMLSIPLERKQYYLELEDPLVRLEMVGKLIEEMTARE